MSQTVSITLINGAMAVLEQPFWYVPALQDTAELGHIARYFTAAPLWAWAEACQRSDADPSPSYGEQALEQFFERVAQDGIAGQDLCNAALF